MILHSSIQQELIHYSCDHHPFTKALNFTGDLFENPNWNIFFSTHGVPELRSTDIFDKQRSFLCQLAHDLQFTVTSQAIS